MEPPQTKVNYVILTTVLAVSKYEPVVQGYKEGTDTMLVKEDRGWFVLFEGSRERLYFGNEEPQFKKGDKVKITFERIDDGPELKEPLPLQTSLGQAPSN